MNVRWMVIYTVIALLVSVVACSALPDSDDHLHNKAVSQQEGGRSLLPSPFFNHTANNRGSFPGSGTSGISLSRIPVSGPIHSAASDPADVSFQFVRSWGTGYSFDLPSGVAVDSDGNVYVADSENDRIQKFDVSGVFLTSWGSEGNNPGQFEYPEGITVDSDGNIYVSDSDNNRIQKFTSTGAFLKTWGAYGTSNESFKSPHGIATDSTGNVYVADMNNHRISKFTSKGDFVEKWGTEGSGDDDLSYPTGVAIDGLGNIYVSDTDNHRIKKLSPSGSVLAIWGAKGSGDNQFSYPFGIAVDSGGTIYVADDDNNCIKRLNAAGEFLTPLGEVGSKPGQFHEPHDVAVDSGGNLYVADAENDRIQKMAPSGSWSPWNSHGTGSGEFYFPYGIAVDTNGSMYVADTYNCRIQKFNGNGIFQAAWGTLGHATGQFRGPIGVAVDSDGNVYVVDSGNDRIQKFDGSGTFLTSWGKTGTINGTFDLPFGIAAGPDDTIYVTDVDNDRVQKFDSAGTFLTSWTITKPGSSYSLSVAGIAVDADNNVYVSDYDNSRMYRFNSEGLLLSDWGSEGTGTGKFENPSGVGVDSSGNIYVTDTNNCRIQVFNRNGDFLTAWGSLGVNTSSFYLPFCIAIDSGGYVHVGDTYNNRVQTFALPLSITGISPVSVPNSGNVTLNITGTGFHTRSRISLTRPGYTPIQSTRLSYNSSNNISCIFPVKNAATGLWNVAVTNPFGRNTIKANALTITLATMITIISPASGDTTRDLPVTITGLNFKAGAVVELANKNTTWPGIIQQRTSNQIRAIFPLTRMAKGMYDLKVTNTDGTSAIRVNAFALGLAPKITEISPASGYNLWNQPVTISGSNFRTGVKVSLSNRSCVLACTVQQSTSTRIRAILPLTRVTAGKYTLRVTNTDGTNGKKTDGFTVKATGKKPIIRSIKPDSGVITANTPVNITGSGFRKGIAVQLKKGKVTKNVSIKTRSETIIVCSFPTKGLATGKWNVQLTNADHSTVTKTNGFTVKKKATDGIVSEPGDGTVLSTKVLSPPSSLASPGHSLAGGVIIPFSGPVMTRGYLFLI